MSIRAGIFSSEVFHDETFKMNSALLCNKYVVICGRWVNFLCVVAKGRYLFEHTPIFPKARDILAV